MEGAQGAKGDTPKKTRLEATERPYDKAKRY